MSKKNKKAFSIQNILDNLMANPIGGDINSDACTVKKNKVIITCWNGKRYELKLKRLSNGPKFDTNTGAPILTPSTKESTVQG